MTIPSESDKLDQVPPADQATNANHELTEKELSNVAGGFITVKLSQPVVSTSTLSSGGSTPPPSSG